MSHESCARNVKTLLFTVNTVDSTVWTLSTRAHTILQQSCCRDIREQAEHLTNGLATFCRTKFSSQNVSRNLRLASYESQKKIIKSQILDISVHVLARKVLAARTSSFSWTSALWIPIHSNCQLGTVTSSTASDSPEKLFRPFLKLK